LESARAKANQALAEAKRGECPVDQLEKVATAGGVTVEALAEKFLSDYVHLKQLRAARKYEMAIRVHIVDGVGRVIADCADTRPSSRPHEKSAEPSAKRAGATGPTSWWKGSCQNGISSAAEND